MEILTLQQFEADGKKCRACGEGLKGTLVNPGRSGAIPPTGSHTTANAAPALPREESPSSIAAPATQEAGLTAQAERPSRAAAALGLELEAPLNRQLDFHDEGTARGGSGSRDEETSATDD